MDKFQNFLLSFYKFLSFRAGNFDKEICDKFNHHSNEKVYSYKMGNKMEKLYLMIITQWLCQWIKIRAGTFFYIHKTDVNKTHQFIL